MFSDHDETSPSITAVSAPSVGVASPQIPTGRLILPPTPSDARGCHFTAVGGSVLQRGGIGRVRERV